MIKHVLQTLFSLFVTLLTVQQALAEPVNKFPFDKDISERNRQVIERAMEIVKKECPYLATLDWANLPSAYTIDLKAAGADNKPVLFSEIGISSRGSFFYDPHGDLAARGWVKSVGISVDNDINVSSFLIGIGAGTQPGIRGVYHADAKRQFRGAEECDLALIDGQYYFRDVPALGILNELE